MSTVEILVTGGNGFIGSRLITALKRNSDGEITNIPKKVQELSDDEFNSCRVIYHLGAIPRVGYSIEHPEEVLKNNFESTLRVLEYCRTHPETRLINVSSSSVRFAKLVHNPYALSKHMCEQLVDLYRVTYDVNASNVRLFNVYGPGEADYGSYTTLIKVCKKRLLTGEDFRMDGDGSARRDFTHVDDVVNGLIAIDRLLASDEAFALYELGGADPVSVKEVIEEFQRGTNLKIIRGAARPSDPIQTSADPHYRPEGWLPVYDVLHYIQDWKAMGCPND